MALVGHYLKAVRAVFDRLDVALPMRTGVINSDIVRAYLALLVQGKSDFDAIENFRGDTFFKQSLGIGLLPSSATLRQRMDSGAVQLVEHVPALIETLLGAVRPDLGVLPCGWLPLDIDVFPMDNSGTKASSWWIMIIPLDSESRIDRFSKTAPSYRISPS